MTAFIKESPLRQARQLAEMEVSQKATAADIRWLYENPLLWLRALVRLLSDVENAIAKSKLAIVPLKPVGNTHASEEYLVAKSQVDLKNQGRLHYRGLVMRRIEEVKVILGPDPVDRVMVGDLIEAFTSISYNADAGELEHAADLALFWAKKLAGKPTRRSGT